MTNQDQQVGVELDKIYKLFDKYPIESRWSDVGSYWVSRGGWLADYSAEMFPDDLFFDIHYAAALAAHNRIAEVNLGTR
jgi:hypothetical protein